ncbi:hypothetical protein MAH1_02790 [Sessilibacter sp. MAH1]
MGSYSTYSSYKPSCLEWLGDIPTTWKTTRVKFLGDLILGLTYSPDDVVRDEGSLVLRSSNIQNGKLDLADRVYVNRDIPKKIVTRKNDILICSRNGSRALIGKCALLTEEVEGQAFGAFMTVLRSEYASFLYYVLNSSLFNFQSGRFLTSTINQLTTQTLGDFEIALPPIEEQQTIARFLDFKTAQIDALIAKKKALLDKLAEKRTALISHTVTKGLDPTVPMKDSGVEWLGEIPEHWDAKRLKFTVSIFGGGTPNTGKPEYWNGDIPWVSPKDMKLDFIATTEDYLTEIGVAESATKIVPVDSVLIVVRSGILRHTIPVARNTVEVSLNQDMKALVTDEKLRPGFLHWLINGLQNGLLPIWSKQGCTVESIEMDYMRNTVIPLPPVIEQDAIIEEISKLTASVNTQIDKVSSVITALSEYRSALITNAVTGKIDVRDWEAA